MAQEPVLFRNRRCDTVCLHDPGRARVASIIQPFGISILRFLNKEIYKNLDAVLEMIGSEVLAPRRETGKS